MKIYTLLIQASFTTPDINSKNSKSRPNVIVARNDEKLADQLITLPDNLFSSNRTKMLNIITTGNAIFHTMAFSEENFLIIADNRHI